MKSNDMRRSPWTWIPSLYFAEGIPNILVTFLACFMYKRLGLSNTDAALYTSWLYLPWVIKPFWSPIVDMLKSKRWWILVMQILLGTSMAGVAFTIPANHFVQWTLCFFWLMAFSSATHDIAADGFYMIALNQHEQSLYVGVRSTFYRVSTIAGQGVLTIFAGAMEAYTRSPSKAWSYTFFLATIVFFLLYFWHAFMLPHSAEDKASQTIAEQNQFIEFFLTFINFFKKPGIGVAILFMLLYRLPEALLTKICPFFFVDPVNKGGLGLATSEIGFLQGTVGVVGLLLGGIIGGIAIAKGGGFRKWLWPMVFSITIPDMVYIFLAYYQPNNFMLINVLVFMEQFGYGFGFTAYMLYLMYFSQGPSKTAHYAFCTGFMALSMMLPGLVSGWLQDKIGYLNFFIVVCCLTPLTFLAASLIKVPDDYGK